MNQAIDRQAGAQIAGVNAGAGQGLVVTDAPQAKRAVAWSKITRPNGEPTDKSTLHRLMPPARSEAPDSMRLNCVRPQRLLPRWGGRFHEKSDKECEYVFRPKFRGEGNALFSFART